MHALVVFESMYGNTQAIAEAVARGLATHGTVDVVEVGAAPDQVPPGVDLLVVGAPTHAFGLSRASTRADAAARVPNTTLVSHGRGVREWLDLVRTTATGTEAVAFDTRVRKPRVPGSAAHKADKELRRHGFTVADAPETFWVEGVTGPLVPGDLRRAQTWGDALGRTAKDTLTV
ncbi:flavodoxin family protein [Cellulomonas soli]|uniref:Flavodoxin n=1 Tax=Cellulomonas soli TaxID=931535 RepID=A0A512PAG9_9CELL|nr:flavodoxin family protein [Cellulomonas soli]NYI60694.1 hypothetical protein [Cellulomonas soli]GEP68209.1 flavodoxin [Cellulomonas soli]